MADELIDICDENLVPIGQAMKGLAHRTGLWHQAIHCWFVRKEDDKTFLMFQKRGGDKDLFPDCLDITAAGHYRAGEKIADGVREIFEELGHSVAFDELISLGVKVDLGKTATILNHEFCHVFLYETRLRIHDFQLDANEVEGLVEIEVADGLSLFSGEIDRVFASGVSWDRSSKTWRNVNLSVKTDQFIPRVDPYYYKMFINAERYFEGRRHLSI